MGVQQFTMMARVGAHMLKSPQRLGAIVPSAGKQPAMAVGFVLLRLTSLMMQSLYKLGAIVPVWEQARRQASGQAPLVMTVGLHPQHAFLHSHTRV